MWIKSKTGAAEKPQEGGAVQPGSGSEGAHAQRWACLGGVAHTAQAQAALGRRGPRPTQRRGRALDRQGLGGVGGGHLRGGGLREAGFGGGHLKGGGSERGGVL